MSTAQNESAGYLAEPTIQYLYQVLDQIRAGEILFPRFQRFNVWKPEQRKELLRSISEGIPIGTLLIWRTRHTDVKIERNVGTHMLPLPRKGDVTKQYVLDGVQRLSTLFSALFPTTQTDARADDGETASDFRMYYDLKEQDFVSESEIEDETPQSHHLPLTVLGESIRLLRFQRGLSGGDSEQLTERADAVARAFREYKVPVVPLASDDLAHATKTFQRINTQGTPMSEVHMVNALVYSNSFDLLERIRDARQELLAPVGWEGLEDEAILRTIKALLHIDVYATRPDETRRELVKRPEIVERAVEALAKTATFLRKEMNIRSPDMVPYASQIVLLARTIAEAPELKRKGRMALRDWVSLTTYAELFASNMSASRFDMLAEELKRAARGRALVWSVRRPLARRDLPPTFDFRHARARFLALRMSVCSGGDKGARVLAKDGVEAVPALITARMTARKGQWMQSPGARVYAASGSLTSVRDRLLSKSVDQEFLDANLFPAETHGLILQGYYEKAVRSREKYLNAIERAEFEELLERHPRLQAVTRKPVRAQGSTSKPTRPAGRRTSKAKR